MQQHLSFACTNIYDPNLGFSFLHDLARKTLSQDHGCELWRDIGVYVFSDLEYWASACSVTSAFQTCLNLILDISLLSSDGLLTS